MEVEGAHKAGCSDLNEIFKQFIQGFKESGQVTATEVSILPGFTLKYISNVYKILDQYLAKHAFSPKMDIIPKSYEGGFKLWECTQELIKYLVENQKSDIPSHSFKGKRILELGCGHGLVSIALLLLQGSDIKSLSMQDYNLEVLMFAVIPNLLLNGLEEIIPRLQFLSGDWASTLQKAKEGISELDLGDGLVKREGTECFDIMIASEVLYEPSSYDKIAQLIDQGLSPDGECIIATKLYYYGVGGSYEDFKEFCEKKYPQFAVKELKTNYQKNKTSLITFSITKKKGSN